MHIKPFNENNVFEEKEIKQIEGRYSFFSGSLGSPSCEAAKLRNCETAKLRGSEAPKLRNSDAPNLRSFEAPNSKVGNSRSGAAEHCNIEKHSIVDLAGQ